MGGGPPPVATASGRLAGRRTRRPANGDFLLYPAVCRYQRALAALEGVCGVLALETGARLESDRPSGGGP